MIRQPAKVLEPVDVRRLLKHVNTTRYPIRNRTIVLLSFKAGLRACEIAGLTWPMVLNSNGKPGAMVNVCRQIAKLGHARNIPMHADLKVVLKELYREQGKPRDGPVIRSERLRHMTARSVVNWFATAYAQLDLDGCSSHSGSIPTKEREVPQDYA
jgi:integrase/recombinase XerD